MYINQQNQGACEGFPIRVCGLTVSLAQESREYGMKCLSSSYLEEVEGKGENNSMLFGWKETKRKERGVNKRSIYLTCWGKCDRKRQFLCKRTDRKGNNY